MKGHQTAARSPTAFKYLSSQLPSSISVQFAGANFLFTNNGQRPIKDVQFSATPGQATAFTWKEDSRTNTGLVYLGSWQSEYDKPRGCRYLVFCLRDKAPSAEIDLDRSFKDGLLLQNLSFSKRDGKNAWRKKEALALDQQANMEVYGDKIVLGRWDDNGSDFIEGSAEVFRRLAWVAIAKDRLRSDVNFHVNGKATKRIKKRGSPNTSTHPARARLEPCVPKADENYLVKIGATEKFRSRTHMRILNELVSLAKKAGLNPKQNKAIDVATESKNGPVIFEVKITPTVNALRAIREGVGQLYEYRYFGIVQRNSFLCLTVPQRPSTEIVSYLENDRQIGILWKNKVGFDGESWTKQELSKRGYNIPLS